MNDNSKYLKKKKKKTTVHREASGQFSRERQIRVYHYEKQGQQRAVISLRLKEKLVGNQNSLGGSQISGISLSGEGSDSWDFPSLPLAVAQGLFHKL